ncbi:MAG: hypothetical protein ILO34_09110 [Kiritimatiellae bacterium]|nr:hypothetical protein [Kiritimatiellia bacterium]
MATMKSGRFAVSCAVAAAMLCATARADGEAEAENELEEEEDSFVSAEVALKFDSRYLSYGLADNKDPILTPSGSLTFGDLLTVGADVIYDITRYGHKAGYTSREWKINEFDPYVQIGSELSADEYDWLPTSIEYDIGYMYEYHPRTKGKYDRSWCKDTQFVYADLTFTDCPLNPHFYFERDIDRDNGTYVNLEFSHEFSIVEDTLALTPSVAQGFGNTQRVAGYLFHDDGSPYRHGGLMDTLFKLELTWTLCENVELSGYVGYSDYLFDRNMRHAARNYEATGRVDDSYNFIGGLAATLSF